jgi:hypothetical protein
LESPVGPAASPAFGAAAATVGAVREDAVLRGEVAGSAKDPVRGETAGLSNVESSRSADKSEPRATVDVFAVEDVAAAFLALVSAFFALDRSALVVLSSVVAAVMFCAAAVLDCEAEVTCAWACSTARCALVRVFWDWATASSISSELIDASSWPVVTVSPALTFTAVTSPAPVNAIVLVTAGEMLPWAETVVVTVPATTVAVRVTPAAWLDSPDGLKTK